MAERSVTAIRLISRFRSFSRAAGAAVALGGGLVLAGWIFDIGVLKSVLAGRVTMKANTALAFVLAGLPLWMSPSETAHRGSRRLTRACAAMVALIGLLTLSECLFGWDLGIDQLLFTEPPGAVGTSASGRMAPTTALDFLMLGLALFLLDAPRSVQVVEALSLASALIGFLAFTGYAYGVGALYGLASYTQMPLQTAVMLILLGLAILLARPDRGLMSLVTSDSAAGLMVRRLLPVTMGVLFLVGWSGVTAQRANLYGSELQVTLVVLVETIILGLVIWSNAGMLYKTEALRERAEAAREAAQAELKESLEESAAVRAANEALQKEITDRKRAEAAARALAEVGRELVESPHVEKATHLDVQKVTQRIVSTVRPLFRARRAALFRLERASGALVCVAASGEGGQAKWIGGALPTGAGVAGQAAINGRPVWSSDVSIDKRFTVPDWLRRQVEEEGLGSEVAVPLKIGDGVIGALGLADARGRSFSREELDLLLAFADQAALALHNARLYEEAERRLRRTETLLTVSRSVGSTLDLTETMRRVAREIARALGADMVGAYVPDQDGSVLRPLAGYHVPKDSLDAFRQWPMPLKGHRFVEEAWERRQPVFSTDAASDPRIDRKSLAHFRPRSLLFAPMVVEDTLVGGFGVVWFERQHAFTSEELNLAEGIARQAALAVANARLFAESERRRLAAESLAEVGRLVSRSLDPDVVGQRIADSVRALVRADRSTVYRLVPESGELVALALSGEVWASLGPDLVLPPGTGLAGLAVRERRPVLTPDILTDPRVTLAPEARARFERVGARAELAVPLLVKDRAIGALGLGVGAGRQFDDGDVRLTQAFADQAAMALENSRLYAERVKAEAELRTRVRQQAAVAELGRRALAGTDLPALLDEAVALVARTLEVEYCNVLELLPNRDALLLRAGLGLRDGYVGRATVGAGTASQAGYTLLSQEPVIVEDLLTETRFERPQLLLELGVVSGVSVIIKGQDTPFGVLAAHTARRRNFAQDDVHFLRTVANVLAAAIDRRRAEAAVLAGREQLQVLSRRLVEIQEAERREIARELHDEIGQVLTGLKLTLEMTARTAAEAVQSRLDDAQRLVNDLIRQVREMSLDLRPAMLDDLGLLPTLVWHFERYTTRTGVRVTFEHAGLERRFQPEVETAAYRIVQEALTNVARHAGVPEVAVRVWAGEEVLNLQVEDRGKGFDTLAARPSGGLTGMRERATLLGGNLAVESAAGAGTRVTAEFPLRVGPLERRYAAR